MKNYRFPALLLLTLLAAAGAFAQNTQRIGFYGMGTSVHGTAALGDATTDISLDASDFFDKLEMAGIAEYRFDAPGWSIAVNPVFFSLGQTTDHLELDLDTTMVDLTGGWKVSKTTEAFAGLRYTDLSATVDGQRPVSGEAIHLENGDTFLDPILGIRFNTPISGAWWAKGQGDVGGFGVSGMKLEWQARAEVGYRLGKATTIWVGYDALHQKFENQGESEQFDLDVTYRGPTFGVTFDF